MMKIISRFHPHTFGRALLTAERALPPYIALSLLGLAVYSAALWFPPTAYDDLAYLYSVAGTRNPLFYFVQDHGHGNYLYRPFTSISLWLVFRVFGVWALPNQLINLALHLLISFLLFRTLRRIRGESTLPLLLAALFVASQYTFTTATVVSDRPMALTGLFFLLLIDHMVSGNSAPGDNVVMPVRVSYVALLSILAVLSKESGLVLPLFAILLALLPQRYSSLAAQTRVRLVFASSAVILCYLLLRILIFGYHTASYNQDGYMLLGLLRYDNLSSLPIAFQYIGYTENVVKNLLAPVFPIFLGSGGLLTRWNFLLATPIFIPTVLLAGLAASRQPTRIQIMAITAILANAIVHYALFRYRLLYLSQIAFCLFVGSSPLLRYDEGSAGKVAAAKMLAMVLLLFSALWISYALHNYTVGRTLALSDLAARLGQMPSQMEKHIVETVLEMYK